MDVTSPSSDATFLMQMIQLFFALGFVIALMLGLSYILKRLGLAGAPDTGMHLKGGQKRLSISESLVLGPKHRLALIKRDDMEHLVILGSNGDTVIETHITRDAAASHKSATASKASKTKTAATKKPRAKAKA